MLRRSFLKMVGAGVLAPAMAKANLVLPDEALAATFTDAPMALSTKPYFGFSFDHIPAGIYEFSYSRKQDGLWTRHAHSIEIETSGKGSIRVAMDEPDIVLSQVQFGQQWDGGGENLIHSGLEINLCNASIEFPPVEESTNLCGNSMEIRADDWCKEESGLILESQDAETLAINQQRVRDLINELPAII